MGNDASTSSGEACDMDCDRRGGQDNEFADYESSRMALPRDDGLCCRPQCLKQQWSKGSMTSAYCGVECANDYTAGFKEDCTREQLTSQFFAAVNTCRSQTELSELQQSWADVVAHLPFPPEHLRQIGHICIARLKELQDEQNPPSAPTHDRTGTLVTTADVLWGTSVCCSLQPAQHACSTAESILVACTFC
eukprot:m.440137 g.440137  ORF g.440137 m.440137 type:complete len:192 (-) comp21463_c0_seq22:354-929(-)